MSVHEEYLDPKNLQSVWTGGKKPFAVIGGVAVVGLLAAVAQALMTDEGHRRFMLAYLTAFAFALSLSIGAIFFVFIQHLTHAGWSVALRRPAEAMAANMPVVAILFIPILVSVLMGKGEVYPWAQHPHEKAAAGHVASAEGSAAKDELPAYRTLDKLTLAKRPFLNQTFFVIRWVFFLGLWSWMGLVFWKNSRKQDESRDVGPTHTMEGMAAPVALVFGLTVTFGAFDLLMSLNPHWYSTMFGVYFFTGAVVGALATMTITITTLQRHGMMTRAIGEAHYLDLGRLLFAFLFFWAYIAFSQYMLLWYANIPETTAWMSQRGLTLVSADMSGWSYVGWGLFACHFAIPFCGLMSRHIKRRVGLLTFWAIWMLVMHYIDLYWIVMPEFSKHVPVGFIEIGTLLGVTGIYALGFLTRLSKHSLIPIGDPRLLESTRHENIY